MTTSTGRPVADLFAPHHHDPEGVAWAAACGDDWRAAWLGCPRPGWCMRVVSLLGGDLEAYTRAGLRCAGIALRTIVDVPDELIGAHATLTSWLEGQVEDHAARVALGRASACSRQLAGLQGDPPSPARDRRRALASVANSLVRAVADLRSQPIRGHSCGMIWPSAADLARAAVRYAGADLVGFDREASAAVRDALAGWQPAATRPRPPVREPAPPCFVEVGTADPAAWSALRRVWNDAAWRKAAGRLRPGAPRWVPLAPPGADEHLRDILTSLGNGDYRMLRAIAVDGERGRLRFAPGGFPYGGTAPIHRLAALYACPVLRTSSGAGE
jgi:hypothetical protein